MISSEDEALSTVAAVIQALVEGNQTLTPPSNGSWRLPGQQSKSRTALEHQLASLIRHVYHLQSMEQEVRKRQLMNEAFQKALREIG
ncbi:unnamed protein product [Penicillium manginii]